MSKTKLRFEVASMTPSDKDLFLELLQDAILQDANWKMYKLLPRYNKLLQYLKEREI